MVFRMCFVWLELRVAVVIRPFLCRSLPNKSTLPKTSQNPWTNQDKHKNLSSPPPRAPRLNQASQRSRLQGHPKACRRIHQGMAEVAAHGHLAGGLDQLGQQVSKMHPVCHREINYWNRTRRWVKEQQERQRNRGGLIPKKQKSSACLVIISGQPVLLQATTSNQRPTSLFRRAKCLIMKSFNAFSSKQQQRTGVYSRFI